MHSNGTTLTGHTVMTFCPRDLDFNVMTLIYDYDLDIRYIYLHTTSPTVRAQPGQTDRQTDR